MLVVAKIARGRAAYYLEHLSGADEPDGGLTERPGRWLGGLAGRFGLEGEVVTGEALARVLAGRHPGEDTWLHPSANRVRIAAFDCTFATPKSVSLLHALGPSEVGATVADAHGRAVETALAYLADHGLALRRRGPDGGVHQEPAASALVAAFVHRTSRASEPHLHTHALVVNAAPDLTGRCSALDARPLYLHLRSASSLYDAELRARLVGELGVVWRSRSTGALELSGLPDAVLAAFSSRSREIGAELAERGFDGRRAGEIAAARTREPKDRSRSYPELVARWREAAYDLGVSDGRWAALLGPPPGPRGRERGVPGVPDPVDALVAASAARLEAPFSRRELVAAAARRSIDGAQAAELEAAVDGLLGGDAAIEPLGEQPARLLGDRGRPLPAGRHEAVFRGEALGRLEAAVAEELSGRDRARVALCTIRPGTTLEALGELADRARRGVDAGLAVRAHAPTVRDAAAFEGCTGIPTSAGGAVPLPSPTGLLLVAGADRVPLASLEQLLAVSRVRGAGIVLVVGPSGSDKRRPSPQGRLLAAGAEPIETARWRAEDLAVTGPGAAEGRAGNASEAHGRALGRPGVAYAADPKAAVAAALGALDERRRRGERAVLVAPEPSIATALERVVPDATRAAVADLQPVVGLAGLPLLVERHRVASLVVLGAPPARGLDKPSITVAVAPIAPLERPFAEHAVALGRRRSLRDRLDERRPDMARDLHRHGGAEGRSLGRS